MSDLLCFITFIKLYRIKYYKNVIFFPCLRLYPVKNVINSIPLFNSMGISKFEDDSQTQIKSSFVKCHEINLMDKHFINNYSAKSVIILINILSFLILNSYKVTLPHGKHFRIMSIIKLYNTHSRLNTALKIDEAYANNKLTYIDPYDN